MFKRAEKGFTLLELLFTVVIIGILAIVISPSLRTFLAVKSSANYQKQYLINQRIGQGLLDYASVTSTSFSGDIQKGALPSPFSDNSKYIVGTVPFKSAPADPTNVANGSVTQFIQGRGVGSNEIAATSSELRSTARVYQTSGNIPKAIPLYTSSGPTVNLRYQFGVIYNTNCVISATCYSSNSIPASTSSEASAGSINAMGSSTAGLNWVPNSLDYAVSYVSTLPIQRAMLETTANRLDAIRDAIASYYSVASASAGGVALSSNLYPGTSVASTANAANNYCLSTWVNVSSILPTIGLSGDFAITAWDAPIQYCRDFDPTGAASANSAPHYAAIRINSKVSINAAPVANDTGCSIEETSVSAPCNVVLTI